MISPMVKLHLAKIVVGEPISLKNVEVKWVSELDPCFSVVMGQYIFVKPTQGIFKKRLCNSKNNSIFV
jgi:hypothetical protein